MYLYIWNDMSSAEFVAQIGGRMAVSSRKPGFSLSAATLQEIPARTRLVLPSPNGSALSLLTGNVPTLAGCLRNAQAVAREAQRLGERISVIPGGEGWENGILRVAIEDWLGAGAILANLGGNFSAEAKLARLAFESSSGQLAGLLEQSISGQELIEKGRLKDIQLAAELNISTCAPLFRDRAYMGCSD